MQEFMAGGAEGSSEAQEGERMKENVQRMEEKVQEMKENVQRMKEKVQSIFPNIEKQKKYVPSPAELPTVGSSFDNEHHPQV